MNNNILNSLGINEDSNSSNINNTTDDSNENYTGASIVSFLIPLVGLIIYAIHITDNKKLAKKCLDSAGAGLILGIFIAGICWAVIMDL